MEIFVLTFVHSEKANANAQKSDTKKNVYKMFGRHCLKLVCSASFTFVALDESGSKTVVVPQFTARSAFEKSLYALAERRYAEKKALRRRKRYRPTVVVGPSGVGKGTLLARLRAHFGDALSVAVSHTTRKARKGEENGREYHFVTHSEFEAEIARGAFVEYARIYGNLYGTSTQSVRRVMDSERICLLEIDYVGAKLIKESAIDANYLFITVDGEERTCAQRIRGRGSESEAQIEKRVETAKTEFTFFKENRDFFDASISNDDLETATQQMIDLFAKWYPWL